MSFPSSRPIRKEKPDQSAVLHGNVNWRDVDVLNRAYAKTTTVDLLEDVTRIFGDAICFACSFGLEDVVLLDLLAAEKQSNVAFVTLDTLRLPPETIQFRTVLEARYTIQFHVLRPDGDDLAHFQNTIGDDGIFETMDARRSCCAVRKVEPLRRFLAERKAWVTGMRRGQSAARSQIEPFEWDIENGGKLKVNPLWNWSEQDLIDYINDRQLTVHPLHHQGVPSIGCAPCTRPVEGWRYGHVQPTIDTRAGRWWWEPKTSSQECGLHSHPSSSFTPLNRRKGIHTSS